MRKSVRPAQADLSIVESKLDCRSAVIFAGSAVSIANCPEEPALVACGRAGPTVADRGSKSIARRSFSSVRAGRNYQQWPTAASDREESMIYELRTDRGSMNSAQSLAADVVPAKNASLPDVPGAAWSSDAGSADTAAAQS